MKTARHGDDPPPQRAPYYYNLTPAMRAVLRIGRAEGHRWYLRRWSWTVNDGAVVSVTVKAAIARGWMEITYQDDRRALAVITPKGLQVLAKRCVHENHQL